MSAILHAQIDTSFRGEDLHLKGELDLDKLHYDPEEPIKVYHHIATQNGIDSMSYLYEVIEMEPVHYSSEHPRIQAFISEDGCHFDWAGYEEDKKLQHAEKATERLLNHYFNESQQAADPNLKKALQAAYLLGAENG